MIFPSISEYCEALKFKGALKSHRQLKLMTDESGEPRFSSGKFAVVFRLHEEYTGKEFAVKCFVRGQEQRQKSYELISENLNKFCGPYLVHFEYLPDEVRVNSRMAGDDEYPIVIMEWVESKTLGQKLTELCSNADKPGIFLLACAFDRMALWLMEQPFSHGDLNTENILVEPDGTLKLIDYDGMFTPEMAGELARENGSSGFQHPLRSVDNFGTHIDDFSILLISLSLHVLAEIPSLYDQHNFGGSILFDEAELLKPGSGKIWEAIESARSNNEISQRLVMMYMAVENPAEMRLFGIESILNDAAAKAPEPSIKTSFRDELPKLIPYRKGDKWGFCDRNKRMVIDYNYDEAEPFIEGLAKIGQNGKYGYIDKTGKEIALCKYDDTEMFCDGLSRVFIGQIDYTYGISKYGIWGYIDKTGKELIPSKYDNACNFSEGLACVYLNGKWGYIEKTGKEVVSFKYDEAESFKEGLARVQLDGKWGYIDKAGTDAIICKYDEAEDFSDGIAMVKFNWKWGFIDKAGKEMISFKYESADSFSEGLAFVSNEERYRFIDKNENDIFECKYWNIRSFSNGLAQVELNYKRGFIDKTGKEVIPCIFDHADDFCEGLTCVELNTMYGFIDKTGKQVIEFKYDFASNFNRGLAYVGLNRKCGYIDRNGNEYWENSDTEVIALSSEISICDPNFAGRKTGKTGEYIMVRNRSGNLIKVELDKGCPPGTNRFQIKQLRAIEDIGEVKKGAVFLKAYGIVVEDEE